MLGSETAVTMNHLNPFIDTWNSLQNLRCYTKRRRISLRMSFFFIHFGRVKASLIRLPLWSLNSNVRIAVIVEGILQVTKTHKKVKCLSYI